MAWQHPLGRFEEIFRNFYDLKQHLSLRAFLGVGRGEGSWKKNKKHRKEKLLAKVVTFHRMLSCWFHSSSVNPAGEWSIPQTAASEPQLYI